MSQPRFFIITNDAARAMLRFSCHTGNLPGWIAVLDSFDDWMKIPSGANCMGLWFGTAAELEGWRNAWAVRKERGDLFGITGDELGKIDAWFETNRAAPARALLYGECDDVPVEVSPSHDDALRPSQPQIDSPDRFVPAAQGRASKWT